MGAAPSSRTPVCARRWVGVLWYPPVFCPRQGTRIHPPPHPAWPHRLGLGATVPPPSHWHLSLGALLAGLEVLHSEHSPGILTQLILVAPTQRDKHGQCLPPPSKRGQPQSLGNTLGLGARGTGESPGGLLVHAVGQDGTHSKTPAGSGLLGGRAACSPSPLCLSFPCR